MTTLTPCQLLILLFLMACGLPLTILEVHRSLTTPPPPPSPPPPWGLAICLPPVVVFLLGRSLIRAFGEEADLETGIWGTLFTMGLATVVTAAMVRRYPDGPRSIGWRDEGKGTTLLSALRAYLAFVPLLFLLLYLSLQIGGWLHPDEPPPIQEPLRLLLDPSLSPPTGLALFFFALIGAPVTEEILFRGLFYSALRRYCSPLVCASISGLAFGWVHSDPWRLLPLAIFGMFLALLRERSRSLAPPILVHFFHNSMMLFLVLSPWMDHGASSPLF